MPVDRRIRAGLTIAVLATLPSTLAHAEDLTAEQAVARAAKDSPSLRASLLDVKGAKASLEAEDGARDPTFFASLQGQYNESLGATQTTVTRGSSESVDGTAG